MVIIRNQQRQLYNALACILALVVVVLLDVVVDVVVQIDRVSVLSFDVPYPISTRTTTRSNQPDYYYRQQQRKIPLLNSYFCSITNNNHHYHHHHGYFIKSILRATSNDDSNDSKGNGNNVENKNIRSAKESTQEQQQEKQKKIAKKQQKDNVPLTIGDLRRDLLLHPTLYINDIRDANNKNNNERKRNKTTGTSSTATTTRRTRKRVDQPKQQYVYASQRKKFGTTKVNDNDTNHLETIPVSNDSIIQTATSKSTTAIGNKDSLLLAKEYGYISSKQHCDPSINPKDVPKIIASIRVGVPAEPVFAVSDKNNNLDHSIDNTTTSTSSSSSSTSNSAMMAYIIYKPAGWSILGASNNNNNNQSKTKKQKDDHQNNMIDNDSSTNSNNSSDNSHNADEGEEKEYNELDIMALMTPEEIQEYYQDNNISIHEQNKINNHLITLRDNDNKDNDMNEVVVSSSNDNESNQIYIDDEMMKNKNPQTISNLRKIMARAATINKKVDLDNDSIETTIDSNNNKYIRPSIIAWLKDTKMASGIPIRGGNYWTAIAGAIDVDDTGFVLVCPKINQNNIHINYVEYIAVIGNGCRLDDTIPTVPSAATTTLSVPSTIKDKLSEPVTISSYAKLRRGRGDDTIETVKVIISDRPSTCNHVVRICQEQYNDGVRGDPTSNPFDRRAQRRLIHCNAMSVSSTIHENDIVEIETDRLPDDIAILAERRNHLEYKNGSFLGRATIRDNPLTNAYREINGAADGFPGWVVDRYGNYLIVYHDTKHPKGPLPSIHDGNTLGVYYLESNTNRNNNNSNMGTESDTSRPRLLEGRPAPDTFPIMENGITYLVSLDRDLSTGIFLDQRLHRAWLSRHCTTKTRILNCFAHTGAYSVAAATAGASTVSLDISKKWLDRLPEQLALNNIEFDDHHDCIYGDCFDWLVRLSKRNELYDIVILDPPSTSIGQKRKRWSIQDMDELVALAVPLVKKGGLLWTTTNSASIPITKFARLCYKGFNDAGVQNVKLERIQPMPTDFSSIGPQPVKNLVWRLP
jgi:23S rRNA (cytosine1962-C5)-methyltransferase